MQPVLVVTGDIKYLKQATLRKVDDVYIIQCYFNSIGWCNEIVIEENIEPTPYVYQDDVWMQAKDAKRTFLHYETWMGEGSRFVVREEYDKQYVAEFTVAIVHPRSTMLQVVANYINNWSAQIFIATESFAGRLWSDDNEIDSYPKEK